MFMPSFQIYTINGGWRQQRSDCSCVAPLRQSDNCNII